MNIIEAIKKSKELGLRFRQVGTAIWIDPNICSGLPIEYINDSEFEIQENLEKPLEFWTNLSKNGGIDDLFHSEKDAISFIINKSNHIRTVHLKEVEPE